MAKKDNIYNIKNHEHEFFGTQDWVRDKLYEMIPNNVKTILDPCAGECGLEDFSKDYKYTLFDIVNRNEHITEVCDFLKKEYNGETFDAVVVNPPFNLLDEFVSKCFYYSDDIYLVAPLKTTMKKYRNLIANYYGNWRISFECYGVLTSIALFHLHKNNFDYDYNYIDPYSKLLPKVVKENSLLNVNFIYTDTHTENKPFILQLITKGRILRNETIINDTDIHEAGDDSVFIATATSANLKTKKGDKIKRYIKYFDTIEDAKQYQKWFNDNDEYVRQYCYEYGSNLINLNEIPYNIK